MAKFFGSLKGESLRFLLCDLEVDGDRLENPARGFQPNAQ